MILVKNIYIICVHFFGSCGIFYMEFEMASTNKWPESIDSPHVVVN